MLTTLNMGLIAWDQGGDPYRHADLANNFEAIDNHDHSPGKGVKIGTNGIQNAAITNPLLAPNAVANPNLQANSVASANIQPNAVGNTQLADNAVSTSKVQDGAVTSLKLSPGTAPLLGEVRAVYTYPTWALAPGWAICDGSPWSGIPNDMGLTTGNILDLRNRFILGAAQTGTGTGPTLPPAIGSTGGGNTTSISHTHSIPAHTHSVPDHTHPIQSDGDHYHTYQTYDSSGNVVYYPLASRNVGEAPGAQWAALFLPNFQPPTSPGWEYIDGSGTDFKTTSPDPSHVVNRSAPSSGTHGGHSHGGGTSGSSLGSGGVTGSGGAGTTGAASTDLSGVDTRPNFVGLLYVMRVRNT